MLPWIAYGDVNSNNPYLSSERMIRSAQSWGSTGWAMMRWRQPPRECGLTIARSGGVSRRFVDSWSWSRGPRPGCVAGFAPYCSKMAARSIASVRSIRSRRQTRGQLVKTVVRCGPGPGDARSRPSVPGRIYASSADRCEPSRSAGFF